MADLAFLEQDAVDVAPLLLGATLRANGVRVRLTEVEAYMGERDPGSHAYRGPGRRNATMFGPAGRLYVYFTYGMHYCCNVVTGREGVASAVLLRAGEVVEGLELARERRPNAARDAELASGPARLTRVLGISLADDDTDLAAGPIRLEAAPDRAPAIASGPRTGVAGPGGGLEFPWRFWIPGEPSVSRYRPHVARRR